MTIILMSKPIFEEFICEKGIQFVRIDGSTLARDRQTAVENFRLSYEVKIAIIGIAAGGVGLDFSAAQNVVFLELPKSASEMLQAHSLKQENICLADKPQLNFKNKYSEPSRNTHPRAPIVVPWMSGVVGA